jgi:hypothetical protein
MKIQLKVTIDHNTSVIKNQRYQRSHDFGHLLSSEEELYGHRVSRVVERNFRLLVTLVFANLKVDKNLLFKKKLGLRCR